MSTADEVDDDLANLDERETIHILGMIIALSSAE